MSTHAQSFMEVIKNRFACKVFDETRKIPQPDFNLVLEAGRYAPSSLGFEPWEFLVVRNQSVRETVYAHSWGLTSQKSGLSELVILCARQPKAMAPDSPYIQKTIMEDTQKLPDEARTLRTTRYAEFREKDFDLDSSERAGFEWTARQCYLAAENMLLMAASLGIDSCPVEGFHRENLEKALAGEKVLDRSTFGIACMLAFGYAKGDGGRKPKTRRPLDQVMRVID